MLEQFFFKINYLKEIVVGSRKYKTTTICNVDITVIPRMFIDIINRYVLLSFLFDNLFIYLWTGKLFTKSIKAVFHLNKSF